MAVYTREDLTPSLIENTTMQKVFRDGVHTVYEITPVSGYVLHDNAFDDAAVDDEGNLTGEVVLGYRTSTVTCGANYDFTANHREFYTVLIESVPADRIFGSVGNSPITT